MISMICKDCGNTLESCYLVTRDDEKLYPRCVCSYCEEVYYVLVEEEEGGMPNQ